MSKQNQRRASLIYRLLLALIIFFLLPTSFFFIYLSIFKAPASAIFPHFYVTLSLLAGTTALKLMFSTSSLGPRTRMMLNALVVVVTAAWMLFFYGLVLVGLTYWGRVPTIVLVQTYFLQSTDLLKALGYNPQITAIFFCAISAISLLAAYAYQVRFDWSDPLSKYISSPIRTLVALVCVCVAAIAYVTFPDRGWSSLGEPLSLSVYPEQGAVVMQNHSIDVIRSARIDQEEDAARASYKTNANATRSNVVLIVVDALRADHLSLLGYARRTTPNLVRRAENGSMRLGTSALSVCNESSCGLRALASSQYLDRQAKKPFTLHEVLKRHGYQIRLILSGDHTNFYGLRDIYGPVDTYFDAVHQNRRYVNDDRLIIDELQRIGQSNNIPTMLQFHLMSAHALGQRLDETPAFGASENYTALHASVSSDTSLSQRATNFYDRGVAQADQMIEQILQQLEHLGFLKNAIVIITGDHGESLGERGRYAHTHSVWEEALRVPFLIFTYGIPKMEGFATDRVISQIDVAPTILQALDISAPVTWQGTPVQARSRPGIIYFQQTNFIGLLDGRDPKVLYKHWHDMTSSEEFTFELESDPKEASNITQHVSAALRYEWRTLLLARSAAIAPSRIGKWSEQTRH